MTGRIILVLLLGLSGCAAVESYPTPPSDLGVTTEIIDSQTLQNDLKDYGSLSSDDQFTLRNKIMYSEIAEIDQSYVGFRGALIRQENSITLSSDFASLLLAGLGATTGSAATKAALAAASIGIIGTNAAISKDVLYTKTITTLITEMDADRDTVLARIYTGLKAPVSQYPLETSSRDLRDYYDAGTLVDAIQNLQQTAGTNAKQATVAVSNAISGTYSYDSLSVKIEKYWMPDGKTINTANQANIVGCMKENNISEVIPFLINSDSGSRPIIVSCLKL